MEKVIKQGNAIYLYYLNFLGIVMLRLVLVTLSDMRCAERSKNVVQKKVAVRHTAKTAKEA